MNESPLLTAAPDVLLELARKAWQRRRRAKANVDRLSRMRLSPGMRKDLHRSEMDVIQADAELERILGAGNAG